MATSDSTRHEHGTPCDDSAGGAVRVYLARHVARLFDAVPGVRAGEDHAVHDARVATRRVRTALGAFRGVLDPDVTETVRAELRELGHLLGAARDPVVELRALRRHLADEPDELILGPVVRRIEEDRSAARAGAFDRLRTVLDDDRTLRLLDGMGALAVEAPPGRRSGADASFLKKRVRKAWTRMDRALEACDGLVGADRDEALHAARKAARRARYAAEVMVPVAGRPARRSVHRARDVQDALGAQHDTVLRRDTLRRVAVEAYLDGENAFTFGRLHALEQLAGEQAIRAARRPVSRAQDRRARSWFEQA